MVGQSLTLALQVTSVNRWPILFFRPLGNILDRLTLIWTVWPKLGSKAVLWIRIHGYIINIVEKIERKAIFFQN